MNAGRNRSSRDVLGVDGGTVDVGGAGAAGGGVPGR